VTSAMRFAKFALVLLLATCTWSAAAPASAAPRPLPPLTPAKHDALTRALDQGRLTESQYALARARSLFTLSRVRSERAEAKAILSRPDGAPAFLGEPNWDFDADPRRDCEGGRPLCFHWDDNT